ncbi:hypothetical protein [Granulicella sp. S156]
MRAVRSVLDEWRVRGS